jgi:hypothetical protein
MGWVSEEGTTEHEGHVVGLVEDDTVVGGYVRLRELVYPKDDYRLQRVRFFQAGCECGWRSRVFFAPNKAEWSPFILELHDADVEEEARQLWRQHCAAERQGYVRLVPSKGTG